MSPLAATSPRHQDPAPATTEARALQSLREGEDLVAEATTHRIEMMGSLRATKQCLDCHHAHRGDLLGAFSYELQRDQAPGQ